MSLKKIIIGFAFFMLLLVTSVTVFLYWKDFTLDLSSYNQLISKKISAELGSPIHINGPIKLLMTFKPSILAEQIELKFPAQTEPPQVTKIDSVNLAFDLTNLSGKDWLKLFELTAVIPTDILMRLGDTQIEAYGTLSLKNQLLRSQFNIDVKGQRLADINLFSANNLPEIGPYHIVTKLSQEPGNLSLNDIKANLLETIFEGDIQYNYQNTKPTLQSRLSIAKFRFPPIETADNKKTNQLVPPAFAILDRINARIDLHVDQLDIQNVQLSGVNASAELKDGYIKIPKLSANYEDMQVNADASIEVNALATAAGSGTAAIVPAKFNIRVANQSAMLEGKYHYLSPAHNFSGKAIIKGKHPTSLSKLWHIELPGIETYSIDSEISAENGSFRFGPVSANLNRTEISGQVNLGIQNSQPQIRAQLLADSVYISDWIMHGTSNGQITLSSVLRSFDADIDVQIGSIQNTDFALSSLHLQGKLQNRKIDEFNYSFEMGNAQYKGDISIDATSKQATINLNTKAQNFDLGRFPIAKIKELPFNVHSNTVALSLQANANTLSDFERSLAFQLKSVDNELTMTHKQNNNRSWEIRDFTIDAGTKKINASANVSIRNTALAFELSLNRPQSLQLPTEPLDLQLNVSHANNALKLQLASVIPFDWRKESYFGELTGTDLSQLGPLFNTELPNIGIYSLNAQVNLPGNGIVLSSASASTGKSSAQGDFHYLIENNTITITSNIKSDHLKLSELIPTDFLANTKSTKPADSKQTSSSDTNKDIVKKKVPTFVDKVYYRLSPMNLDLNLNVDYIETGEIPLENLQVKIFSKDGNVKIQPIQVTLPGGRIYAHFNVSKQAELYEIDLKTHVEQFDYGFLAKYISTESSAQGHLSADIELKSVAPTFEELSKHAQGHINGLIWPELIGSYLLEVWGAGILQSTMMAFFPSKEHKYNCIVGYFDVVDGIMESRALVIDTTRINIQGSGTINLYTRQLDLTVRPKAKATAILANDFPMVIRGTFDDYKIEPKGGVVTGGILGTIVRVPTNIITFPYRAIVDAQAPKDGEVVCEGQTEAEQ